MSTETVESRPPGRSLPWWGFLIIVLVYLAIIQGVGRLVGDPGSDSALETSREFFESIFLSIAISAIFAIAVATWLGWWRPIIHEPRRAQSWVKIVPIGLVVAAAVGTSWANLFSAPVALVLLLVALVLTVGFTEELMFRGIGLEMFRRMDLTEGKVALYSSVVFGAVHLSNALATGVGAIGQAAAVSFSGYLFYLTRRRAGLIWVAMVVHGSQDFVMLSGQIGPDPEQSPLSLLVVLVMIALAILLWRRRDRIELESGVVTGASAPGRRG